jgi:SAM-dependent methyltransferase
MAFREELYRGYVSSAKGPAETWWRHKYLPLLADLDRNAPILELGCGSGELLAFLRQHGFVHARGVDISPEQVLRARARGVAAEVADIFEVLGHEQAALIIAVDVLEHFTRDELVRLAPLLYQALLPGGRLLIQTANGAGLFPRQVIYGDLTHMTILTPQTLAQLLRPCGFQTLQFYETGPIPIRLRGRVDVALWTLLKGVANFVRTVETGKRQAIWTENFICLAAKAPYSTP